MEPEIGVFDVCEPVVELPNVTLDSIYAYLMSLDRRLATIEESITNTTAEIAGILEGMKAHPLISKMFGIK